MKIPTDKSADNHDALNNPTKDDVPEDNGENPDETEKVLALDNEATEEIAEECIKQDEVSEPSVGDPQESVSVEKALSALSEELAGLRQQLQIKDSQNAEKQVIIDRLFTEVQEHRNGLLNKLKEVYLNEFISAQDSIEKTKEDLAAKSEITPDVNRLLDAMADFADDIEDRLFNLGATVIEQEDDLFDPQTQKVLLKEVTCDVAQDKRVSQLVRRGYLWDGRVLRPQLVKIFTYTPNTKTTDNE